MTKRALTEELSSEDHSNKKSRLQSDGPFVKVATAENAASVDHNPPFDQLMNAMNNGLRNVSKGEAIVYWMRLEDLRIEDNRAFHAASKQAKSDDIPLIVLFVISPQDYKAHDRGPRRIDFMLRNLKVLKKQLDQMHIPLHTIVVKPRKIIPEQVINMLQSWNCTRLYANISYEVDELRRDIGTHDIGKANNIKCEFIQDKLIINPGVLKTKEGKAYTVYSPWERKWVEVLNKNLDWIEEVPKPLPNNNAIHDSNVFSSLFDSHIPDAVEGLDCPDKKEMSNYWPAGHDVAMKVLDAFLYTKARPDQIGENSPISENAEICDKGSRIKQYSEGRNHADMNTTSRLSPYLASGVLSARACIRAVMALSKRKNVEGSRDNSTGMWIQEIAWRDFYNHVLVAFPRVSMGRPYNEKFADVKWEKNDDHLQAWKEGRTGVPIIDAAMRQLNQFGWMHNRCRMIVAMYLTKDLLLDWRLGEKYFMEQLIDGDLASNNGGWQWSASTGTDPQPYFRIFNPYSQSQKADPSGNYIRHYVPELSKLSGTAIHQPSAESVSKHGYQKPLVDHKASRERALRRYKNPGEE